MFSPRVIAFSVVGVRKLESESLVHALVMSIGSCFKTLVGISRRPVSSGFI